MKLLHRNCFQIQTHAILTEHKSHQKFHKISCSMTREWWEWWDRIEVQIGNTYRYRSKNLEGMYTRNKLLPNANTISISFFWVAIIAWIINAGPTNITLFSHYPTACSRTKTLQSEGIISNPYPFLHFFEKTMGDLANFCFSSLRYSQK